MYVGLKRHILRVKTVNKRQLYFSPASYIVASSLLCFSTKYMLSFNNMIFNNHYSSYFLRQSDFSIPSYNTVTYGKHSLRYLGL